LFRKRFIMTHRHRRTPVKALVAAVSIACFLAFAQGAVTHAVAAEPWETWPPKKTAPGETAPDTGAYRAGEYAGEKTYAGLTAGTWGWIALGTAAVVGLAFALGGGGGNGGTTSTQTH
jgi:hypothetical protein